MYPALLNQSPPAPYQMQSPQTSPAMPSTATPAMQPQYNMPQSYAHGGRPKRGKMVMAHMNPNELHVLDHIQGKQERCPRSNMRSYSHLEELLKNPHILHKVHQHVQHHAHGGMAHGYDQGGMPSAANGVHGDTELAMIGPHTHQVFNQLSKMQGYTDRDLTNPHDGRPQYWSLGDTLGGIWNGVKGGAQKAYDTVKPLAQNAYETAKPIAQGAYDLGKRGAEGAYDLGKQGVEGVQHFAQDHPGLVRGIGTVGQKVLPKLTDYAAEKATERWGPGAGLAVEGLGFLGQEGADYMSKYGLPEDVKPEHDPAAGMGLAAAQGLEKAYANRQAGMGRGASIASGINTALGRFSGPAAGAVQGMNQSMSQGQYGPRSMLKSGVGGAYTGGGGNAGIRSAAKNLMSRGQNGQSLGSSLREMSHGSVIHGMPTPDSMNNQDAFGQLPFAGGYG